MLNSLRAYGVAPDDVTDVLFTHLHFDHVGWATQQGNVVFTNATHRCHRADWDHFVNGDDPKAAAKMAPLTDRMEFWETDCTIAPGLDVVGAPGHTPGSTIMVVSSGAEKAMLLGDVVHCPVELVEDDWEALFDVDPVLARQTRETLARELEGTDVQLAAAHFPGLEFGRLLRGTPMRSFVYS
jgi:glyoxylase-like metal-dependent hydrolase (beta-lactamase superfamily II)